jgi:hypothetical protein
MFLSSTFVITEGGRILVKAFSRSRSFQFFVVIHHSALCHLPEMVLSQPMQGVESETHYEEDTNSKWMTMVGGNT